MTVVVVHGGRGGDRGVYTNSAQFTLLVKQFILYQILFIDSPFGSEKVAFGISAIESSVLAAKVYFLLHCSESEDIAELFSNTVV